MPIDIINIRPKCRYEERTTPPSPARALFLSFSPSIHHGKIPSFHKFHCDHHHGLQAPTACRKVSHFSPTVPQSIHHTPRLPVPPPSPTATLPLKQSKGCVEGEGKTKIKKTKKRHFSPVWHKHSLLESHRTVLGAISTELGGAGRERRRKRNQLSFR